MSRFLLKMPRKPSLISIVVVMLLLVTLLTIGTVPGEGTRTGSEIERDFSVKILEDNNIKLTDETYVTVRGLAIGDVDNDGAAEIVATHAPYASNHNKPQLYVLERNGTEYYIDAIFPDIDTQRGYNSINPPVQMIIEDIDYDGKNELVFMGTVSGNNGVHIWEYYHGQRTDQMTLATSYQVGFSGNRDLSFGDIDHDGRGELLVMDSGTIDMYDVYEDKATLKMSYKGGTGQTYGDW